MRITFLTLAMMVVGSLAFGQVASINWMSLEEAVAAQQNEPRKIMMDVYTQWCPPCKRMMAMTFTNSDVIEYLNANYYAVKFDAQSPTPLEYMGKVYSNPNHNPNLKPEQRNAVHSLAQALGVRAYPTLVFFNEDASIIAPISGFRDPKSLERYLKFFQEKYDDAADKQTTWEAFNQSFIPSW